MQTRRTLDRIISLSNNVETLGIHQETFRAQAVSTAFAHGGTHYEANVDDGMAYRSPGVKQINVFSNTDKKTYLANHWMAIASDRLRS